MTIFVRPARAEDSEIFTRWYVDSQSFDRNFHLLETYTLCAFRRSKILGYMIVESFPEYQVLNCFIPNPLSTDLEKAGSCRELVKHIITLGYLKHCYQVFFIGNKPETNKIGSHIFTETVEHKFDTDYPVFRLNIKELEG